jgi:hypothetical protein
VAKLTLEPLASSASVLTDEEMEVINKLVEGSSNEDVRKPVKKPSIQKAKNGSHSSPTHGSRSKKPHSDSGKFGVTPKKNNLKGANKKPNTRRSKSR